MDERTKTLALMAAIVATRQVNAPGNHAPAYPTAAQATSAAESLLAAVEASRDKK